LRTLYLSLLTEDLEDPAFARVRDALERAKKLGAEVVALPGAPVSVRAPSAVLEAVLAAVERR
jgi:predicted amino acid dehydrogenase